MSLREEMWKYEQITGESAEHVPIIKLGAFLDGYEMATKTLKRESSDDCISREDAIGIVARIKEMHIDNREQYPINYGTICDIDLALQQLPSVTPQQTRWIPVTERLPDTDNEVLCWYKYYHWSREKVLPEYGLGRYLQNTQAWYGEVAIGKDVEVIAWMPLPEPYKESEE